MSFSAFYNEKHNGRTLSWLYSVGDRFDNTIAFFDAHGVDHVNLSRHNHQPRVIQCGTGTRTRTRQCGGFFSTDDIDKATLNLRPLHTSLPKNGSSLFYYSQ